MAQKETGKYEEALKSLRNAIKLDNSNPKNFLAVGIALHENEQYDRAIKSFETVIKLEPENEEAPSWLERSKKRLEAGS